MTPINKASSPGSAAPSPDIVGTYIEPNEVRRDELTKTLMGIWDITKHTRDISEPDGDPLPLVFMHCAGEIPVAIDVTPFINLPDRELVGFFIQRLVAGHRRMPETVTLMTMAYFRKADETGTPIGKRQECLLMHMETPDGHCADLFSNVSRSEGQGPVFSDPKINVRSGGYDSAGDLANFYRLIRDAASEEGSGKTKQ